MRLLAYAALVLATAALGGCGGDDAASPPAGPTKQPDGTASVEEFDAYTQDVDEVWEGSPATAAGIFLRLDERAVSRTTVEATAAPEGGGPQTVVVTLDGLGDDSVRAERWTLSFEPDGDVYRLTDARWAQRCQPNRGHQVFSPEPCV